MKKPLVVFLSMADYAGSGFQAVQAINSVGRIGARHITCFQHPARFAADLVLPSVGTNTPVDHFPDYKKACAILAEADLIHCWNDEYKDFRGIQRSKYKAFLGEFPHYPAKYKSATFTGSWYRLHQAEIDARLKEQRTKLIVNTPAFLTRADFDDRFLHKLYIPHAFDVRHTKPSKISDRDPYTIGVYPHCATTANLDIALLKKILAAYPEWRVKLEEKLQHKVHMKELAKCMFFMQHTDTRMISYGRSTVEAMALGIPVFNSICWQGGLLWNDCPIIDISPSTLRYAFEFALTLDYAALCARTRAWVGEVHDYSVVGEQYTTVFEELLNA